MDIYKKYKNKTIEILGGFTRTSWTLGINISWSWWDEKDHSGLEENCFAIDFHILCFELSINYWWKPKMRGA